jgi:hypothetical protein
MVRLLPILFPGPKSHLEKQSSQLFTLQQTASARGASGISCLSKSFLWRSGVDKDIRLTIISILDVSQEAMKGASKARTLTKFTKRWCKLASPATWKHTKLAVKICTLN